MKIKMTRDMAGKKAGDIINTTPGAATLLIDHGYAEEVKTGRPKKTPTTDGGGGDSSTD